MATVVKACPVCPWADTLHVGEGLADGAALGRVLDDQTDRYHAHLATHTIGEYVAMIDRLRAQLANPV